MNTVADIVALSRECASRHLHEPDRAWRMAGMAIAACYVVWMLFAYAL